MIQKGIIKELLLNENRILVRIPILESAGGQEVVLSCLIMNQPGIVNGYQVGDVVFIAFENQDLDTPIVVGKLYTGTNNLSSSAFIGDSLTVSGKATFSAEFEVGGITYKELLSATKNLKQQEYNESSESSIYVVSGNDLSNGNFSKANLYYASSDSDDNLFKENNLYLGQDSGNISKVSLTAVPTNPAVTEWKITSPTSIEYGAPLKSVTYSYTLRRPQDFKKLVFESDNDTSDPNKDITPDPIISSKTGTETSAKQEGYTTRTFKLSATLKNDTVLADKSASVTQLYRQFAYATNEENIATILANLKDIVSSQTKINTYLQNTYPSRVEMSLGNEYTYVYFIMNKPLTITDITSGGYPVPNEQLTTSVQFTNHYNYSYDVNIYRTINKINGDIKFDIS